MIRRIHVEKREAHAHEARTRLSELQTLLGIRGLRGLRLLNRYDIEGLSEEAFARCLWTVFAQPQTDLVHEALPEAGRVLAVEYLPGQFDQRADAAEQCAQFVTAGERPEVRNARIYLLDGEVSDAEMARIRAWLINPVDSREASLDLPTQLKPEAARPADVAILTGFRALDDEAARAAYLEAQGFAMGSDDLAVCVEHFRREGRDPSVTEMRVLDTYWSDHCRHTTFLTALESLRIDDARAQATLERAETLRVELGRADRPLTLMELATLGARALVAQGRLPDLDASEEVNACTVRVRIDVDGEDEDWLLLFKNETHNHPTEIEPFGGAATCIGGAIRDPLSGRGYVYQAMRVTGAGDPTQPIEETLEGKLPQRVICQEAARGYASYGNQIGIATGLVEELYHPGYVAKRMELGAVIAATPAEPVRRLTPEAGDVVLLVGGRTGRDGLGGATGSSQAHDERSLDNSGAEVQKGNAPEERKLQRLFRRPEALRLIRRCNDFGAGGVSVAIGELAPGLDIDLDRVPVKYDGLDGTELAISESQERMAVLVAASDAAAFIDYAAEENLECTAVATVTDRGRMRMHWRGQLIVDLDRALLDSNGAPKRSTAHVSAPRPLPQRFSYDGDLEASLRRLVTDLNICSQRGLGERFDSSVGAATLLLPYGGVRQRTPAQAMAARLPVLGGTTRSASIMAYGCDPYLLEADPYAGAWLAVYEAVARAVATGAELERCWLSLQEFFPRPGETPTRWGLPLAALLGALAAQLDLGLGAIGGKDSMSGSFETLDVPPTLVAFAAAMSVEEAIRSPEFKSTGSTLWLLEAPRDEAGLPEPDAVRAYLDAASALIRSPRVRAAATVGAGGLAERLFLSALGNGLGVRVADDIEPAALFELRHGAFVLEGPADLDEGLALPEGARLSRLGETLASPELHVADTRIDLLALEADWESSLASIYPGTPAPPADQTARVVAPPTAPAPASARARRGGLARPRVLLPVFPGTNCEYDTMAAFERAGAEVDSLIIHNRSVADVQGAVEAMADALARSQILFLSGGFSGGDEPDGAGKFITSFLRHPRIAAAVAQLLQEQDGLIGGICNGFQALIKLGLLPWGEIRDGEPTDPTLSYNLSGRHEARLVRTRVAATGSPWLEGSQVGDIQRVPVSHGEGRFVCSPERLDELIARGQIVSQYVDAAGWPSMAPDANPNGSLLAVEGLISPDGRVLGRMGHRERMLDGLYRNDGDWAATLDPAAGRARDWPLFANAVRYYR